MVPVILCHLAIIHAIKMVACQDEYIFGTRALDFLDLLAHSVCCTLIPVSGNWRLLSSPNLYSTLVKRVKNIRSRDMPMQRHAQKLGQHRNPVNTRVDTVANGNINKPILSGDRHGGFCALGSEREQTCTPTTTQDNRNNIVTTGHSSFLSILCVIKRPFGHLNHDNKFLIFQYG